MGLKDLLLKALRMGKRSSYIPHIAKQVAQRVVLPHLLSLDWVQRHIELQTIKQFPELYQAVCDWACCIDLLPGRRTGIKCDIQVIECGDI